MQYIVVMGIQGADGQGLQSSPWTDQKPESLDGFFAGASNIIFTFGGWVGGPERGRVGGWWLAVTDHS